MLSTMGKLHVTERGQTKTHNVDNDKYEKQITGREKKINANVQYIYLVKENNICATSN